MYFPISIARVIMSKNNAEFTPFSYLLLISGHILDAFRKLRLFGKWDKAKRINSGNETSLTVQYQKAFLIQAEHECYSKHQLMSVIKPKYDHPSHFFPLANASRFAQSAFDRDNFPVVMTNT